MCRAARGSAALSNAVGFHVAGRPECSHALPCTHWKVMRAPTWPTIQRNACGVAPCPACPAVAGQVAVEHCLSGYNSTIFAYGQTGAGKTYTVMGNVADAEKVPASAAAVVGWAGVIPGNRGAGTCSTRMLRHAVPHACSSTAACAGAPCMHAFTPGARPPTVMHVLTALMHAPPLLPSFTRARSAAWRHACLTTCTRRSPRRPARASRTTAAAPSWRSTTRRSRTCCARLTRGSRSARTPRRGPMWRACRSPAR